jgi:hypothetical protein
VQPIWVQPEAVALPIVNADVESWLLTDLYEL